MDKNDEDMPYTPSSNDLLVSDSEFSRCALCGLWLMEEEIKAHKLCDPTLLDVCPKCQIKAKHMHIPKPAYEPDDLGWLVMRAK